ncbi:ANR family transcriptional regulator, partial [Salmonella enterica subsp. enterica]|nr:ANR family transcriptional regulator [Salmonella enterica]EKC4348805.1 ANR family transcriptional regulator [Salmonella enterica subsp. enterica]
YGKAAELWRRAADAPCNASQRRWAQDRAAFCENAHIKGWRAHGDECQTV